MIGLVLGAVVGALIAPPLTRLFSPHPGSADEPLIAAGIFIGAILVIEGLGSTLGYRARVLTLKTRLAIWDSVAGSISSCLGVLFVAWFVGYTFANSSLERGQHPDQRLCDRAGPAHHRPPAAGLPRQGPGVPPEQRPPQPLQRPDAVAAARTAPRQHRHRRGPGRGGGRLPGDRVRVRRPGRCGGRLGVAGGLRPDADQCSRGRRLVQPDGAASRPAAALRPGGALRPRSRRRHPERPRPRDGPAPHRQRLPGGGAQGAVIGYPEGGPEATVAAAVRGTENASTWNIYYSGYVTRETVIVSADVIPGTPEVRWSISTAG